MSEAIKPPIMGLDVGEVRIGVAISDPFHLIAQPQGYIPAKPHKDSLDAIVQKVEERGVKHIIVGHPINLRGAKTLSTERAERYAEALRETLPEVRIELWDERLSTAQALSALQQGAVRGKKKRQKVDQVAAALILQNYLDFRRNQPENSDQ